MMSSAAPQRTGGRLGSSQPCQVSSHYMGPSTSEPRSTRIYYLLCISFLEDYLLPLHVHSLLLTVFLIRMDPLSIASAIAGLITLSERVVEQGYSFLCTVEGAPRSLRALFLETAAINTVLDQIQTLAAGSVTCADPPSTSSNPALEGLVRLNAISDCENLLKRINGALTKYRQVDGEKVANTGKRILWSFQEREVKEMLTRLSSLREILTTALAVDTG